MELRHLRYFIAVGRCLNFTKAAEILHISQPPLSRQIQEFEEEIGTALFDRQGKKTALTQAGEYLLEESEKLLEGIEAACRTARAISQGSKVLNIGCVSFFMNTSLGPFLEEVRHSNPDLKLELLVMSTEAQEKALLAGSIQIGFVRSWIRQDNLAFVPLTEEALAIVYPAKDDLPQDPQQCLSLLSSRPFIGMSRAVAVGLVDKISSICAEYSITTSTAYECNDAFSIIGLVAAGLGWSIMPDLELRDLHAAGISSLRLPQKIQIGLAYRGSGIPAEARRFLDFAKDHFSGPAR
jgi:DNA-binding transcriptional LysR family regulator